MGRKGRILKQKKEAPKDFQKVKKKVGKAKQPAQNDTKTDYKVKRVQMPTQSMLVEKGEEVTHRKLGLLELLAHAQHHSAKHRRDAFHGLRELCDTHEGVLRGNLSRIFEATSTAAMDVNADVRLAFRTFQAWLLEALPQGAVIAFAPSLALHVRSALSHVSAPVRNDGLLLLELYLGKLGSGVLGPSETDRVIETLCRVNSQSDSVLRCLCQLVRQPLGTHAVGAACSSERLQEESCELVGNPVDLHHEASLSSILQRSLHKPDQMMKGTPGDAYVGVASTQEGSHLGCTFEESPVWGFCLRAWMQAGEVPRCVHSTATAETASKACHAKLQCITALESSLEVAVLGQASEASLKMAYPSASQIEQLVAFLRRGGWPVLVDTPGKVKLMAEHTNLRMVRVIALLATVEEQPLAMRPFVTILIRGAIEYLTKLGKIEAGPVSAEVLRCDASGLVGESQRTTIIAHVFKCLDLLWVCAARHTAGHMQDRWSAKETADLASATARFVAGGADADRASPNSDPLILALPLTATLLGLRLEAIAKLAPTTVRMAWPHNLVAQGSPCLADIIEASAPGSTDAWTSTWPKLLWGLGEYEPSLSEFVLGLLFELARRAVRSSGGVHERLFSRACPLLIPFMVGRTDDDLGYTPPLLVTLPQRSQMLATSLLRLFPKLSQKFAEKLTQVVCTWSAMGARAENSLGNVCFLDCNSCVRVLDAVFRIPQTSNPQWRLRIALTVLTAAPHFAASHVAEPREYVAHRLADFVAAWLMESSTLDEVGCRDVALASQGARRRLALQLLAWPLCNCMLETAPQLAHRSLAFLFFCALRVPPDTIVSQEDADVECFSFLHQVYVAMVQNGLALSPAMLGRDPPDPEQLSCITRAIYGPLCDPKRGTGFPLQDGDAAFDASTGVPGDGQTPRRLATMLVLVWMRAPAYNRRARAYEFLVRLCATQLLQGSAALPMAPADERSAAAPMGGGERSSQWASILCAAACLEACIRYRDENGLDTSEWGSGEGIRHMAVAASSGLTELCLHDLRDALAATCARLFDANPGAQVLCSLGAILPML